MGTGDSDPCPPPPPPPPSHTPMANNHFCFFHRAQVNWGQKRSEFNLLIGITQSGEARLPGRFSRIAYWRIDWAVTCGLHVYSLQQLLFCSGWVVYAVAHYTEKTTTLDWQIKDETVPPLPPFGWVIDVAYFTGEFENVAAVTLTWVFVGLRPYFMNKWRPFATRHNSLAYDCE